MCISKIKEKIDVRLRFPVFFWEKFAEKKVMVFKIHDDDNFILIGIIAIVIVILIIALWYLLKRKSKEIPPRENHAVHSVSVSETLMLEENDCKEIPLKEIYAATDNLHLHNCIGQGVAGKVYKGVLSNGWNVAIKHIIKDGQGETFLREVTSLSHVRHPNLVILRGFCEKQHQFFLVYELCGNGSLSEWLFGKEKVLSWLQRLKIAIGSARGLYFLHTYEGGCIVHRDVKPTNILLNDNFEAKLSDFGLSKLIDLGFSHVSSEVRGTFGYVDPEYRKNHHVNPAGDVYSFGIVLLQIISGKRVISLNMTMPASLDKMAKAIMNGGNTMEFVDPKMNGKFSVEAFNLVLKVAISCTVHKRQRPSMGEVVKKLEKALVISARSSDVFSVSFA